MKANSIADRDRVRADPGTAKLFGLLGLAWLAAVLFAAGPAAAAPAGFVVADGAHFAVTDGSSDQPWTPVGYNQYRLTARPGGYACDGGFGAVSDAELGDWMDQMQASGATVLRTWFFQSMYDADGSGPGAGSWAAFDRVIDAARARGMRVIGVLVNQWDACEPSSAAKTIGFYTNGFREDASYGYSLSFEHYATTVARHYATDPAVAFWQLVNEAEAPGSSCDENAAAAALRGFAAEMSGAIHAVDPNHLISLGTTGSGQCGTAGDDYSRVHQAVDICEVHDYDSSSTSSDDSDNPMPGDLWNGFAKRLDQCGPSGLNQPILVGESGVAADVNAAGERTGSITASTLSARAELIRAKMEAQFGAGMDGYLLWERIRQPSDSGFNTGPRGPFGVGPGDPVEQVLRSYAQPGGAIGGGSSPYADAVLSTAALEGYWRLGEPAGMRTAIDSAGGDDGTYGASVRKGSGLIAADPDAAAVFKTGGSIALGDTADFPERQAFSLEAWIRPQRGRHRRLGGPVISKLQKHWGGYSLATSSSGRLSFELSRGAKIAVVHGPKFAPGSRHQVVAVYDGTMMRLCVDGACPASWSKRDSAKLFDNSAPLTVGGVGRRAFSGTIDEVAVYGAALSEDQIASHATIAGSASDLITPRSGT